MSKQPKAPQLPQPATRENWEKAVRHHADRIRGMLGKQVFGFDVGDNQDAQLVAVYLLGVAEGRKNSEKILAELVKKYQITPIKQ